MTLERESRDHAARLGELLRATLRGLGAGPGQPWALLDFPNHCNIGDSAIWVGETAMLRAMHGRGPDYVSTAGYPPDDLSLLPPEATIYLHGGGNFGDLWPGHQRYRESLLERFKGRRLIQLPQSIHYRDEGGIARTQRAIAGHGAFHLLVRDQQSLNFAHQHFDCAVDLVPDSAFALDPARFGLPPRGSGVEALLRSDHEKSVEAEIGAVAFAGMPVADWQRPSAVWWRASRQAFRLASGGPRKLPLPRLWMALRITTFDRIAIHLTGIGLAQLRRSGVVITDRLHGHILSSLAAVPHVALDNSYGKISGFIEAWGAPSFTRRATSHAEALMLAKELHANYHENGSR